MKVVSNKEFFLLSLAIILLSQGCTMVNNKCAISKQSTLKEVFIDPKEQTAIWGKAEDGNVIKILHIKELPWELVFLKGTSREYTHQVANESFRDAKLSPNKKYIAFSVQCAHHEWSGIYNLTTQDIEIWSFFFDSESGYFYWSPDGKYLAEESDSLKESYHIEVEDFMKKGKKMAIGIDFLQKKGLASLQFQRIIKNDKEYVVFYEVRFVEWSKDSKRVFFKIVPGCSYVQHEGLTDVEKRQMAEERKKIIREQKGMGLWSVDINSGVLEREE